MNDNNQKQSRSNNDFPCSYFEKMMRMMKKYCVADDKNLDCSAMMKKYCQTEDGSYNFKALIKKFDSTAIEKENSNP